MAQDDDQNQDAGKQFVKQLSDVPAQIVDTLTLGPQRRAAGKWIGDKEDQVKKAASDLYQKIAGPKAGDAKKAVPQYKKGGKVKKTGLAVVHKGEKVVPKNKVAKVDKVVKSAGKKSKKYAAKHHEVKKSERKAERKRG